MNHIVVIRETMYELADWGRPVAPSDLAQRERLTTQLPHTLVRILRSRARSQGVSLDALLDRLLHEALALPGEVSVTTSFD